MIAFAHPSRVAVAVPHHAAAQAQSAAENSPTPKSQSAAALGTDWQQGFLELLPDIQGLIRFAFRGLSPERREEAVQEALANALVAYRRLVERGTAELAYATPLARYAVKQVASGRQVACPLNACETLSAYAQRKLGFAVGRLFQPDGTAGVWKEMLVEDRRATPAELAASRLDFAAWWQLLPRRKRRIAAALAAGASTSEAARAFRLTAGRVSQLRRELHLNWQQFQGEGAAAVVAGQ